MNLNKIQSKIKEFVESNQNDLLTSSEYIIYCANLLLALSETTLGMDPKYANLSLTDYFALEKASIDDDSPYISIAMLAHGLIEVSSRFENDE